MPRRLSRGPVRPARRTKWLGFIQTASNATADTYLPLLLSTKLDDMTRPTITRIRASVDLALNAAGSTDSQPVKNVYCGIIVWPDEAIAAGAYPNPDTEADLEAPWMWYGARRMTIGGQQLPMFNSSGAFVNLRSGYTHYDHSMFTVDIDVQAQRIVEPGEGLYFIISQVLASGDDASVTQLVAGRVLVKE